MSIWTIINIAAWVLCAVFLYLILSDLIKVEKGNREEKKLVENNKINIVTNATAVITKFRVKVA